MLRGSVCKLLLRPTTALGVLAERSGMGGEPPGILTVTMPVSGSVVALEKSGAPLQFGAEERQSAEHWKLLPPATYQRYLSCPAKSCTKRMPKKE